MMKQKRRILLVALYLLKYYGEPRPHKQRVLEFIQMWNLMRIMPEDEHIREAGEAASRIDGRSAQTALSSFFEFHIRRLERRTAPCLAGSPRIKILGQGIRLL
jgi:hypothetical protein